MTRCAGADGCPGGWVVARRLVGTIRRTDARSLVLEVTTDLHDLIGTHDHVGIDMPIGIPDRPGRAADVAARRTLGRRGSSVFPTPARPLLDQPDHASANALSRELFGVGISVQAFHLVPKILAVDVLARSIPLPARDRLVLEVHPECSFREMAGDDLPSKHTPEGRELRRALVAANVGALPPVPRGAREDDALDACAVLWSTERFADSRHRTLPATVDGDTAPERDAHGTVMRIVV